MKTKINKLSKVYLIILTLLFGCSEDFLNLSPQGVTAPEDFYKTDEDATAAVMACYNMLQGLNSTGGEWSSLWILKTWLSDEVYSGPGDQPNNDEINQYRFGSNNRVIRDCYKNLYAVIYRANLVIDNFGKLDNPTPYQTIVMAEARTIRAFAYMELVSLWGPVPLVLHELTPGNYEQPNTPVADIYAQIGTDLNDAIPDLPVKDQLSAAGSDISRISKGAAQAFLGKALLFQKKYPESAAAFQEVINSNQYSLIADYSQILRKVSEFGAESLFEISYSSDMNNTWSTPNIWNAPLRTGMHNLMVTLCTPYDGYGSNMGQTGLNGGWGSGSTQYGIYYAHQAAADSVRIHATFLNEAELIAAGGHYRDLEGNLPAGTVNIIRLKYAAWKDESVSPGTGQPEINYGTNLRIIRFADVLLMAAEAYNQTGNDAKALELIRQVRERVSLPDLTVTGTDLLNAIKNERRLELCFEGFRFQDLIRWGDASVVLADQGKLYPNGHFVNGVLQYSEIPNAGFKPHNILLPIPFDEIISNSKIHQNPGY